MPFGQSAGRLFQVEFLFFARFAQSSLLAIAKRRRYSPRLTRIHPGIGPRRLFVPELVPAHWEEEPMSIIRLALWCALLGFLPGVANGQPATSQADAINALRQGGHVIVFRHGATHSDQADTDPLNLTNVAKQRQLNEDGRALAKSIGESMRKLGIPVGRVQTSLFQRAIDTGTLLGFGEVKGSADISEGGLVVTPIENNRRAEALRKLVGEPPPAGTNTVIVSHKPNILDAFGKDWFEVREGEASVFKPDGHGGTKLIVRILAGEWSKLAQASN
jgi:phosphohistidine phosphatase SixA